MRKVYYLKTCDTCRRILKSLPLDGFELQEIKAEPIRADQLDALKAEIGSYEDLFNKRAKKYKAMGLKDEKLSEQDIRQYIMEDYTFLKRPVFVIDGKVFAGNSKNTIEAVNIALNNN